MKDIIVAGGCFWCVESDLDKLPDVVDVISGYTGGETERPTYENYAQGGHREAVRVVYDPEKTKLYDILYHFIKHIDPTDGEGQFTDRGDHYAPAIYISNEEERKIAEDVLRDVEESETYEGVLHVPLLPRTEFWEAEEYHQDYAQKNKEHYQQYRIGSGREDYIQKHG